MKNNFRITGIHLETRDPVSIIVRATNQKEAEWLARQADLEVTSAETTRERQPSHDKERLSQWTRAREQLVSTGRLHERNAKQKREERENRRNKTVATKITRIRERLTKRIDHVLGPNGGFASTNTLLRMVRSLFESSNIIFPPPASEIINTFYSFEYNSDNIIAPMLNVFDDSTLDSCIRSARYFHALRYIASGIVGWMAEGFEDSEVVFEGFGKMSVVLTKMGKYEMLGQCVAILLDQSLNDRLLSRGFDRMASLAEYVLHSNDASTVSKLLEMISSREPLHPLVLRLTRRRDSIIAKVDINGLRDMEGHTFEDILAAKFRTFGFVVHTTKKTGDFGADILLECTDGTRVVVQAKRYQSKVNLKAVQEVAAAVRHYTSDIGIVITSSGYYESARKLASTNDIELWDASDLDAFFAGSIDFSSLKSHL